MHLKSSTNVRSWCGCLATALLTLVLALPVLAQDNVTTDIGTIDVKEAAKAFKKPGYSPYAGRNYPTRVYWGDTHLHTGSSPDATAFGNRLGRRTPTVSPAARR